MKQKRVPTQQQFYAVRSLKFHDTFHDFTNSSSLPESPKNTFLLNPRSLIFCLPSYGFSSTIPFCLPWFTIVKETVTLNI